MGGGLVWGPGVIGVMAGTWSEGVAPGDLAVTWGQPAWLSGRAVAHLGPGFHGLPAGLPR